MNDEFKSLFQETAPAENQGFALVDVGTYEAELTECKLDMQKEPPRLSIWAQITNDERYEGKKLFINYQMGGQGISYLKKDLETLGLDYSDVGSPEDVAQIFFDNLPLQVVVYVSQKEYQGKMYNNTYINELIDMPAHHTPAQRAGPGPGKTYADPKAPGNTQPKTTPTTAKAAPKTAAKPTGKTQNQTSRKPPTRQPEPEPNFDDSNDTPF